MGRQYIRALEPLPLLAWLAIAAAGCAPLRLPAIDPSGRRLFLPHGNYTTLASPTGCLPQPAYTDPAPVPPCPPDSLVIATPPSCSAEPPPTCAAPTVTAPVTPAATTAGCDLLGRGGKQGRLLLAPTKVMMPVGSEVVLVSGLCGQSNSFLANQEVEWMLSPDSVGTFVQAGNDRECFENLLRQTSTKKDGSYAVTETQSKPEVLTRGTPNPADDISVLRGQTWISLTSATEGSSHVTVLAPKAENWDQRRQTASIYWVDVQWILPAPALVTAAQAHALTTTVRRTSGKPLPGWIVRYEIVDPNVTAFSGGKPTSIDVTTDKDGLATTNLVPAKKSSSSQIRIQIIRPSQPTDDLPPMVVGQGFTTVTWSAPDPKITLLGPSTAGIGSTLTYRAEVSNAGDITAKQVTASTSIPPNMTFLQSDPPAKVLGNTLTWDFGDLAPKTVRYVHISFRPDRNATVRFSVRLASADQIQGQKLGAEASIETRVFSSALGVKLAGPDTAQVGQPIPYEIEVTNTGTEPLNDVVIRARLPVGLEHPTERGNLIERTLGEPLPPGTSRKIAVNLVAKQSGRLCQTVEAIADGGHTATANACVNVAEPPRPESKPALDVAIDGPTQGRVGEQVTYSIRVKNTGNVPLTNVRIVNTFDASLYPREASTGFDLNALSRGQIVWLVSRIAPGETVTREGKYECMKEASAAWVRVFVESVEAVRTVREMTTAITAAETRPPLGPREPPPMIAEPIPPEPKNITGEIKVSIADRQDPIQVNGTTTYIVSIENGRNVGDKNVAMTILLPPGLEFIKVNGPTGVESVSQDGRVVEVSPIKEMRPGETLNPFFIEVRGVRIGKHSLKVRVKSFRSPTPVEAEEDTAVNVSG